MEPKKLGNVPADELAIIEEPGAKKVIENQQSFIEETFV